MIRRLTMNDHEQCFAFLRIKAAENLFIIGDIETYGYDQDFQKVWGEFDSKGELIAVLLKYEENYIPYALGDFDARGFAEIIEEDPNFYMMSGLKEITENIAPFIKKELKRKRQTFYAKCTELQLEGTDTTNVMQANPADAEKLVELLNRVPEFNDSTTTVERKRRELENGSSRSFFIEDDEKFVSTASTTAENTLSAMVVGVATLEGHKNKGYATACMVKLCEQLLTEGKELCLFYDNHDAGEIYKRIGFKDIGFWMMYTFEK